MARFGQWKPLAANWADQRSMTPDIISLHTMVMSLDACDAMWRRTGYTGSHSHFGVGWDGTVVQWQDTNRRAAANYNGNHHIISVETADRGTGFPDWNIRDGGAVPAWRPEQLEALAQLIASMCWAHNIPCELIPDSRPGRRGIGYHRQGVPGFMVAGAEQWSVSAGKVCPGNRRIAQIPGVIARARQILAGDTTAPAYPAPEDDMPLTDSDVRKIVDWPLVTRGNRTFSIGQLLIALDDAIGVTKAAVDGVPDAVWATPVARPDGQTPMPAGELLGYADRAASLAAVRTADPAAIAAALLPGLAAALPDHTTVDQATVEAALRNVLRSGIEG